MTDIGHDVSQRSDGESAVAQAQRKAQDGASQVSQQVRQAAAPVQDRIREELTARSSQLGDQAGVLGQALRRAGEELQGQGQSAVARLPEQAASMVEQCAEYLRRSDADRILQDLEGFGRRRPWAVVAGAMAVGLAASRFLKASSSRRYRTWDGESWPAAAPQPASERLRVAPTSGGSASPASGMPTESYAPPTALPDGGAA